MNPKKIRKSSTAFFDIFDRYPREYFVFVFFIVFLLAILKETFAYTVLEYEFYDGLAYKQQVGEVEIPVTRGTIFSAT
jgi:cell division protein FtsI/penicillin-binding protein 2